MSTTQRIIFRILLYLSLFLFFPEVGNVATCFDLCLGTRVRICVMLLSWDKLDYWN